ncbi:serine hydrolase domain-containing protein [Aneurinibacillus sp. REN35]|uniref:serine hydrolase domain-containing protein n=1 Tax=Aneurinibacillus sp. REN35 TaxID=3237286 RepID=UPI0035291810
MKRVDARIKEIMAAHQVIGLSAAVVQGQDICWRGSYGWADYDRRIPVTHDTVFRAASISKTITATALMQLVEQGLCDLDREVGEYVGYKLRNPGYPEHPVTLRQLMTHTSSLQDVYVDFVIASRSENPPMLDLRELLLPQGRYYTEDLWGAYPPEDNGRFEYSNLGAIILATIIEKQSGQRFDLYCQQHIFTPLGMKDTSFAIQDYQQMDRIAVLYEYDEEKKAFHASMDEYRGIKPASIDYSRYVPGTNGSIFGPQGGVRTHASDLSRFMLAHLHDGAWNGVRILQQGTCKQMHSVQWSGHSADRFFCKSGLNFHITEDLVPNRLLIGHAGDAYGLLSGMYFDKEAKRGVIYLMNGLIQRKGGAFFTAEEEICRTLYTK